MSLRQLTVEMLSLLALSAASVYQGAQEPPRGLSVGCKVTRVIDGDTLEVEMQLPATVRLLDCWAEELHQLDAKKKQQAYAAKKHLEHYVGSTGTLYVPWEPNAKLGDAFSFGRVLGHVWVEGKNLSELQVEKGYATKTKGGRLGE